MQDRIPTEVLPGPKTILRLNWEVLAKITQQLAPLTLIVSGNHREQIQISFTSGDPDPPPEAPDLSTVLFCLQRVWWSLFPAAGIGDSHTCCQLAIDWLFRLRAPFISFVVNMDSVTYHEILDLVLFFAQGQHASYFGEEMCTIFFSSCAE